MANPLFNRFGTVNNNVNNNVNGYGNYIANILHQYRQIKNDPGAILDILFQHGKITQQ